MIKLDASQRALIVQFLKFGVVGVIGYTVDVAVLTVCMKVFGMGPYVGRLFSFFIAVTVTWICNRLFTFRGQGQGHAGVQWARFFVVCAGGFILNYGTYAALMATVPLMREYPPLGVAVGSVAGMFFNFFATRQLVFR